MPYLDKKRKDGLLQSDAFYNELFLGLFGFGFWYLGRISLAIIRFTFTIVGLLMIFISQMMYLGSSAQEEIKNDVFILTVTGAVVLGVSLLWNIITLIMIFTADLRDGKGVKIFHWGTDVEENPDLEAEFDEPIEEEPVPVLPVEPEPIVEPETLELQVEPIEPEPIIEPVYFEPEPIVEPEPIPVVNFEENLDIARQIEMVNAEEVQISQLQTVQEVEIPVNFNTLKHIHHTTFTIQEIESGIVDEHFELRGQHDATCHS
ncbi:Uncharacterised protein [Mesomycoplasma dispar]|uniref:Uncharacterized protein n=1 Tax=Mesomycoplasma dispar TaxID=86660 RepID=A0AAJ5NS84_9BACT|nr:hypothetical protein [Mesomycoplasma dispar]AJR12248.1 hypothetical protein MDIS_02365 [Mesomycoplasma dispar]VEU61902.1 Uncharacterised protein [Mesomycoplasma dispar]